MTRYLEIRNLKCFRQIRLELRDFTVLTGLNSSGKSTTIQAILLADLATRGRSEIPLMGESGLSMGGASEVLNREAADRTISVNLSDSQESIAVELRVPEDESALTLLVDSPVIGITKPGILGAYLSAERLGPRDALEIAARPRDVINVGHQGQYTAQVLDQYDRHVVAEERRIPKRHNEDPLPPTLGTQAEAWLSAIVRPTQVKANRVPGTSLATLRFREPTIAAEWVRPANVGFGLSYVLPIVVAGLTVPKDSLFIVENPEAHLHPSGQSLIGEFLARVASSGVQVLLETHSDHVLNGIRRCVVSESVNLSSRDVAIQFFTESGLATQIGVTRVGGLSMWPTHFFDQIEQDLTQISQSASRR